MEIHYRVVIIVDNLIMKIPRCTVYKALTYLTVYIFLYINHNFRILYIKRIEQSETHIKPVVYLILLFTSHEGWEGGHNKFKGCHFGL